MRNIRRSAILVVATVGLAHRAHAQAAAPDSATRKAWVIPAIELPGYFALQSAAARLIYRNEIGEDGRKVYYSTWETTSEHFRKWNWQYDKDPFDVNQFRHPYMGATFYGLWRSTGHGFWSSLVYSNVGSFLWEMAGETGPPSTNDIITTSQAGSLLGEALFRVASTVLPDRPGEHGRLKHGILADLISPPRGLNRRMLGNNFRTNLADIHPPHAWQVGVGFTGEALSRVKDGEASQLQRDATLEYAVTYGLPGKPGYSYHYPLSYFDFQATVLFNRQNPIDNVALRGLLFGRKSGDNGVWGIYGSYDYFAPYLFRISNTALSLGRTRQDWLGDNVAIQTSLLGGVGWGAAGTTAGIAATPASETIRDYHFGVTPQGLASVKLILKNRLMFEGTGRAYYVSGTGSDDERGSERIFRGNAGVTMRLFGGHSLSARYVASRRLAQYGTVADIDLSEQNLTFAYSFVGGNRFGAVHWR